METVAQRVAWLREASGLEARAFAAVAGIHRSYVYFLEGDKTRPLGVSAAGRIASAFGVDPAWLLFGAGRQPSARAVKRRAAEAMQGAA